MRPRNGAAILRVLARARIADSLTAGGKTDAGVERNRVVSDLHGNRHRAVGGFRVPLTFAVGETVQLDKVRQEPKVVSSQPVRPTLLAFR